MTAFHRFARVEAASWQAAEAETGKWEISGKPPFYGTWSTVAPFETGGKNFFTLWTWFLGRPILHKTLSSFITWLMGAFRAESRGKLLKSCTEVSRSRGIYYFVSDVSRCPSWGDRRPWHSFWEEQGWVRREDDLTFCVSLCFVISSADVTALKVKHENLQILFLSSYILLRIFPALH